MYAFDYAKIDEDLCSHRYDMYQFKKGLLYGSKQFLNQYLVNPIDSNNPYGFDQLEYFEGLLEEYVYRKIELHQNQWQQVYQSFLDFAYHELERLANQFGFQTKRKNQFVELVNTDIMRFEPIHVDHRSSEFRLFYTSVRSPMIFETELKVLIQKEKERFDLFIHAWKTVCQAELDQRGLQWPHI